MFYLGPIRRRDASATHKLNKERRYVTALSDTATSATVGDDTYEQSASCDNGGLIYERRQNPEQSAPVRPPLIENRAVRNRRNLNNRRIDIHV